MSFSWLKLPKVDAFELLYIAISIATFSHTQWAAAYTFEGVAPTNPDEYNLWLLKGALIAIAIDVGMLLSARYIKQAASGWIVLSFVVAAISSFYTQIIYIFVHTPLLVAGSGVSQYWNEMITPLMDARVIILPFLLPFLAIIYTIAQIGNHKELKKKELAEQANAKVTVEKVFSDDGLMRLPNSDNKSLPMPPQTLSSYLTPGAVEYYKNSQLDLVMLKFEDPAYPGYMRGPYKSQKAMIGTMQTMYKRRAAKNQLGVIKSINPSDMIVIEDLVDEEVES